MEVSVTKIGSIGLAIISVIRAFVIPTFLGDFFTWIPWLGDYLFTPLFDFVIRFFPLIGAFFSMLLVTKWTRNVYFLFFVGLVFWLFVTFAIKV